MPEQDYASIDLKRRPFRTVLVLLAMTTVVTFTTFLFLFANVMLEVTSSLTSLGLASPLSLLFNAFIWTVLMLVLMLGAVVVSSTVSLDMVSRRRDIGLMKSIGTLTDTIFDHFMAQAVILLLASVVLGIACGTLIYLAGMLWLAAMLPGLQFSFEYPLLHVAGLALVYVFIGYFAAQKPIYDTVREAPIAAMNPDLGMRVRAFGYLDTFGLPFRLAAKAMGRQIKGSRRVLLSLFLSITLASLLWMGGGVVQTTTEVYIERSMGVNVVAIGHPVMLSTYYSAYLLQGEPLANNTSFINSTYMVPPELIALLPSQPGVTGIESRLVEFSTVAEGRATIWNPTLGRYETIGQDRVSTAVVVGLDWDNTLSSWYYEGTPANSSQDAWIGGAMATSMYEDPLVQSLGVHGASLQVKGVAFDILNGGMVAMMDLSVMKELWGVTGENLVLVRLESYDESYIEQLESIATEYGMGTYRQQIALLQNRATVAGIWSLMQPLPLMALIGAFLNLTYFLLVSVFSRFRDYVVMKSIGAKPSFIAKMMIAEGVSIGLKAGLPAVLVSVIISVYILIPDAVVPSILYLPLSVALMLAFIISVVILASVPVYLIFNSRSQLRVSEFSV